ncbi:MAG: methyltransferase domain-containing protein [Cyclobacteriaceae bacterium]
MGIKKLLSKEKTMSPLDKINKRRRLLLESILVDYGKLKGLEIGPLDNPVIKKNKADISCIDYFDAESLRKKISHNPDRDPSRVVELDYVLAGKKISEVVPEERYDYIFSSHVMEHLPNMFGWMRDVGKIIKQGGYIIAFIPDKRYCFDINRPLSTVGELLESYEIDRTKPSLANAFDQRYYHKKVRSVDLWSDYSVHESEISKTFGLKKSYEALELAKKDYFDCHCNLFTPDTFTESIEVSIDLGIQPFHLEKIIETKTPNLDFLVLLKKN